jgi:hypothetical protein
VTNRDDVCERVPTTVKRNIMKYEYLKSDPKRPKKRYNGIVKQGTSEPRLVILKKTNKNLSKAVSIILTIVLLATAFFIATKYIDGIEGEVVHTGNAVYALETVVEAPQPEIKEEVVIVPAVVETPAPELVAVPATCESEILKYNWDTRIARAVMMAESGGNTSIVNNNPRTGDYSIGCFQVNIYGGNARNRPSEEQLKDPAVNVAFAYNLWRNTSWSQSWGAYSNGSYLRFL